jgi:hypothetical protein
MQAVDHGGGDASRFQDKTRHVGGCGARLAARALHSLAFVPGSWSRRGHQIIRCGS